MIFSLLFDIWWGLLILLTISLGVLTVVSFFPAVFRWFDIAGHYRVHYLALLALISGFFLAGAVWLWAWIALFLGIINLVLTLPYIFRTAVRRGQNRQEPVYRLLVVNVLRRNQEYHRLVNLVQTSQPDLIALIEPDQNWIDGLTALGQEYPYQHSALRDDNYGLALLSRWPLVNHQVEYLIAQKIPTIIVRASLPESSLEMVVTHPPPPKSRREVRQRNEQMARLGRALAPNSHPLILCGDFNCTPWVSDFRRMAKTAKLRDSGRGFGFQPTWPSNRWYMAVPIDHALVSGQIEVIGHGIGPPIGSDHLPVFVDFKFL